ncbi:DNA starvation/stationary phase protection protein [Helicobacter sp. MIT 00-7814]|uniref:Dps family protein n=1 Tax=unclassified Helicobacter TaxID=2593540 RepID=UPI000E1F58AA|nr:MULTISPECIES: DNA starvation/stationary phase protection protein [unclassified Helicobacter]RDU52586.1 DNA starvation/stationary phase protection protein [Helicobacter sp. MIT 99-10781]RDU52874.1 DNA starvation/stationary phase protection protein [Helicobacter sp. MIT 00-7814]
MSKVIEQLKQIQADAQVFYVKVHNFHWNVRGMDFHPTHKATQEIYEEFADVFDDVAERVLQLGSVPYVTLADMIKAAKIKEESATSFDSKTIAKAILSDYEYFLKAFLQLSSDADAQGDKVSAAYADDKVAHLQKAIWMLKAQLS